MQLAERLKTTHYESYTYAYPHKTAYRPFKQPYALHELWQQENCEQLFLYVHVPFCEMRCGFCNLFTTANPADTLITRYLQALERQMEQTAIALPQAQWSRLALGGGTPTYLQPHELDQLFTGLAMQLKLNSHALPVGIETSPQTATAERLQVLKQWGVDRVSIGIQSFVEAEARASGRAQRTSEVVKALETIRKAHISILNIDLIYGLPHQTRQSWLYSLEQALNYEPEELYLYPLYVRPLTGLGRQTPLLDDLRQELYAIACERLAAAGYTQVSMRLFRAAHAPQIEAPVYCCQNDGMVGLGVGARSYTQKVQYASEYAVGAASIRQIMQAFIVRKDYRLIDYGFELNREEQQRRFVLQSILQCDGLDSGAYHGRFQSNLQDDLPCLRELEQLELALWNGPQLQLTQRGIAASDVIGPWLYSSAVTHLMEEYQCR